MTSTSATTARETWTTADMGRAMVAHYTSVTPFRAPGVKLGYRERDDGVEGPATYRQGDNCCAFRIVEARGVAMDERRKRYFSAKQYAEEIAGVDLVTFMQQWGTGVRSEARPAAPRVEAFPPLSSVHALWDACVDVDRVPAALAWLTSRGLPVDRVIDAGELRAVPAFAVLPWWARQAGRSWAEAFAIVVPLVDHGGVVRSLHARRTVEDAELSKTSSPAGHTTRALVMGNRLARNMLAGATVAHDHVAHVSRNTTRPAVVLTEGLPSFAAWTSDAQDADADAPAVLGILSGGWTEGHAAHVPDGARVVIDTDHDEAGDAYAKHIAATFNGRSIDLGRMERV